MITSADFNRLDYRKPHLKDKRKRLDNILGIDSEAYITGEPFMFCVSNGDILLPRDIPGVFIEEKYVGTNFMIYNIKYDSGALLYHLPRPVLHKLWRLGKVSHEGFDYTYIPHKMLRIGQNKKYVSFLDLSQFYKMPLDRAAQTYIRDNKLTLRTKRFTPKYVARFFRSIARYCVHDALLTERLGKYLVNKLDEFGITVTALYSCASISFKYFCDYSKVVTSWRFWKNHKDLLMFACDAYEGGKFEVTTRGRFTGMEYDITSAYPYEIANLIDISKAHVIRDRRYRDDATYGFLRCEIRNPAGAHLPCGPMIRNIRVYPAGRFFQAITKEEYDYIKTLHRVDVRILDAVWLMVDSVRYPYRDTIENLFSIKQRYKNKDGMLYNVTKIVQNSFYGKCCQVIENPDGAFVAGPGWNPMYAAIITANTRLQVTKVQNLLGPDCLAVHTDSVMTKVKLPDSLVQNRLGSFEYVDEGTGLLISCGMYQIGKVCAYKGFQTEPQETWENILSKYPHRKKIPYKQLHVESWLEAMSKNHPKSRINVFNEDKKIIDLNCDNKRLWMSSLKARDFLDMEHKSAAKIIVQNAPPSHW